MLGEESAESLKAYLGINERMLGMIEVAMTQEEIAALYNVEGLSNKDVAMLRDLGMPKTAGIIELALGAPKGPKTEPKAKADNFEI